MRARVLCPEGSSTAEEPNRDGAYRIAWQAADGVVTRLVETRGDAVTVLYEGEDRATTVTGRPEGDYLYQVSEVRDGLALTPSEGCRVVVRPYPLPVAFAFFGAGLLVTLFTVLLVVRGHAAHRRGELG